MKHRFFNSKRIILLFTFGLLVVLVLVALLLPYPYSQLFDKTDSSATGSDRIESRYMSEINGIENPADMERQYKRHSAKHKFAIDDDLVVMFAYPDANIRWTGMVFIHHFPSVSEIALDYDGNRLHEQVSSPETRLRMDDLLNDRAFVADLQTRMSEIWGLNDPGTEVLSLIDALEADGDRTEFLGGRPQTLFDASMFIIRMNDQDIMVYEFDDEAARRNVSDRISSDGYEYEEQDGEVTKIIHIEYLDQPNFWVEENLLVQYLGRDRNIIDTLSSVMGMPVTNHGRGETDVCDLSPFSDVVFPRQELVEGPREVMEAELVGDLVLKNGCLRVESLYEGSSYLPIWPPDFMFVEEDDNLIVMDGGGNTVAQVGEEIFMGGGIGSSSGLPDCVIQQLSSRCDGPFWFVGEGVRLNIQRDSKLVEIEVISSDDRDGILLTKHTILDEWVDETSVIKGKLVLYKPMRCPRLKSDSGITDYLPIWPPDYYLQIVDGLVEIRNGSGEIVAQEGLEIVLHGGSIPHRWDSEQYRQLYYNIPGDCYGPYWIVREIP